MGCKSHWKALWGECCCDLGLYKYSGTELDDGNNDCLLSGTNCTTCAFCHLLQGRWFGACGGVFTWNQRGALNVGEASRKVRLKGILLYQVSPALSSKLWALEESPGKALFQQPWFQKTWAGRKMFAAKCPPPRRSPIVKSIQWESAGFFLKAASRFSCSTNNKIRLKQIKSN